MQQLRGSCSSHIPWISLDGFACNIRVSGSKVLPTAPAPAHGSQAVGPTEAQSQEMTAVTPGGILVWYKDPCHVDPSQASLPQS